MTSHGPVSRFTDSIQTDKLRLLYAQSYQAVFFSLIAAIIFAALVHNYVDQRALLIWFSTLFVTSAFRLFLFHNYRRSNPETSSVLKWESPYFVTLIASSVVWGLGTVLLTHDAPMQFQMMTYYFLMGMAGAALGVYSAIRHMALTTIFIILAPATIWLIIRAEQTTILMAIATSFFIISAIRATKILASTLHRSFELTHELSEARDLAEKLARTDTLTELNNRRAFTDLSRQQILYCQRHNHPVSLLLLDLDQFKKINDQFGHDVGDAALQTLANILQQSVRSSDICGRIGGEEFAVLLARTTLQEAAIVAEKIRLAVQHSVVKTPETQFSMTVSIGISASSESLENLLKIADKAMYQAKQSGRNKISTYPDTTQAETFSYH